MNHFWKMKLFLINIKPPCTDWRILCLERLGKRVSFFKILLTQNYKNSNCLFRKKGSFINDHYLKDNKMKSDAVYACIFNDVQAYWNIEEYQYRSIFDLLKLWFWEFEPCMFPNKWEQHWHCFWHISKEYRNQEYFIALCRSVY